MNERILKLVTEARQYAWENETHWSANAEREALFEQKFAELIIEAVLDQVKERAYYTGDRDWSDEVDRPWIQLEFGYGALAK